MTLKTLSLFFGILLSAAHASSKDSSIPYFAAIKPQHGKVCVNVRTGPGHHYPIEWQFTRAYIPVEVIAKFEYWRKINDAEGSVGWVHQNMLTSKRYVLLTHATSLYHKPDNQSSAIAHVEAQVVGQLIECQAQWCKVQVERLKGWISKENIWGINAQETKVK